MAAPTGVLREPLTLRRSTRGHSLEGRSDELEQRGGGRTAVQGSSSKPRGRSVGGRIEKESEADEDTWFETFSSPVKSVLSHLPNPLSTSPITSWHWSGAATAVLFGTLAVLSAVLSASLSAGWALLFYKCVSWHRSTVRVQRRWWVCKRCII